MTGSNEFQPSDASRDAKSTQSKSGWEVADSVASGVGTVARGIGWTLLKLYAVGLIVLGVIGVVLVPDHWWAGLLIVAYGLYLLLGGRWVIW